MTPKVRIAEIVAVVAQQREQRGDLLALLWLNLEAVLAFRNDLFISFDNNRAERDLRMLKVFYAFRSDCGAAALARIRGHLLTLAKQGNAPPAALEAFHEG